jgi:formamidopyrimidine-DNA glycosylase
MPELPEVETVRRGLEPVMAGARIDGLTLRRKDLRFAFPPRFRQRIEGQMLLAMRRRAKYLLADLEGGETLIMHLGMTGRFIIEDQRGRHEQGEFEREVKRHEAHDHVLFALSNGAHLTYNDVRRFGFMDLAPTDALEESPHFAGMGVEPLGNAFHAAHLATLFAGKSAPLKAALLDQRIIAGLGNIYVCEALNRAGLSPKRAAGTTVTKCGAPTAKLERLVSEIRLVIEEAIEAGGSTLRDFAKTDGTLGYFQHRFRAYGRAGEPCQTPQCRGVIRRIVQSGRSTFYCGVCQR